MGTKEDLRQKIRQAFSQADPEDLKRQSASIQAQFLALRQVQKAQTICFYVSLPLEVDTADIIDESLKLKKKVLVPFSHLKEKKLTFHAIQNRNELQKGPFGILQPDPTKTPEANLSEVDLIIVPGLVFDKEGNRIGRGAGFYDRFLGTLHPTILKIGFAFSFQIVTNIPFEEHDQKMNMVLSDL